MSTKIKVKVEEGKMLIPVTVWYSIQDGGDGSAYPSWFLTEEEAIKDQEDMEAWGEPCYGSVETYVGSNIYRAANKK